MTLITIELAEERLQVLQQRADDLDITLEELVQLSINDLLARPQEEFQQAVDYVLKKNAELYRRLA
ncbi:MAG: DNA-binding protein [Roseiflexaceae bacterium]